jgi:hypothetical protein
MSFSKEWVDPAPEVDEHWRLGSDYASAIRMSRWVVGIIVVLVAAMLAYGYTDRTQCGAGFVSLHDRFRTGEP